MIFLSNLTLWAEVHLFKQRKIIYFIGIDQGDHVYDIKRNRYFRTKRLSGLLLNVYPPNNGKSKGNERGENSMLKITLKAARINIGKTLKEAAAEFGIHYETLSNYEADSTNVPRTFFIKLEAVYGVSADLIYFGKQSDYIAALKDSLLKQEA